MVLDLLVTLMTARSWTSSKDKDRLHVAGPDIFNDGTLSLNMVVTIPSYRYLRLYIRKYKTKKMASLLETSVCSMEMRHVAVCERLLVIATVPLPLS